MIVKRASVPKWLRDEPMWLCLLPALLLVPFAGKAFHLDDSAFLEYARVIAADPLRPFDGTYVYEGRRITLRDQPNPLLWPYLIAGVRAVFGESEVAMHLLNLPFAALALWGMRLLAQRLGVSPVLACVLLGISPAFLVMATDVMPDIAFLGLALAALALCVRAVDENSAAAGVISGLLACATFMTRYTGLFVVGLLLVYPVCGRRRAWRAYAPFAVACLGMAGWEFLTWAIAGSGHFQATLRKWSSPFAARRAFRFVCNNLVYVGSELPWPLLTPFLIGLRGARGVIVALSSLALSTAAMEWARISRPSGPWVAAVLAWPAMAVLVDVGTSARAFLTWRTPNRRDVMRLFIAIWLIVSLFSTVRYAHTAVKYMLLPLAAAILWVLDVYGRLGGRARSIARAAMGVSIPATLVLGLLVAWSDYRWAGLYPEFFAQRWPRMAPKRGRAYYGGEWGLRHYAERAGLAPYEGQRLAPDDFVVFADDNSFGLKPHVAGLRAITVVLLRYPGPFAIHDKKHQAGFYSHGWGYMPFVPSNDVVDVLTVAHPYTVSELLPGY
jgi:hypothetical protein